VAVRSSPGKKRQAKQDKSSMATMLLSRKAPDGSQPMGRSRVYCTHPANANRQHNV
jgi:hypothetical protein